MKKILALTLVSALMAGCGGGSSGGDLEADNPDNGSGSDSSQGDGDNGSGTPTDQVTALDGTWKKDCGPVEGQEHYDIVTVTHDRGTFTSSIENYRDASCTLPLEYSPNPTASGSYTVGEDVSLSDGVTATKMDSHITQFNGAPFDINDYNIFYIQNNILYIGKGDADTPQTRPATLDYDRPYYRIN